MSLALVSSEPAENSARLATSCFTACGTVDLANPRSTDVNWAMIAQALSRIARFSGLNGDMGSYSVAQHCVMGADALAIETGDNMLAAHFLLHDAHEAFIGDITRPLEKCFGAVFREQLARLKAKWDDVIYPAAFLPRPSDYSQRIVVDEMDRRMLALECHWFFPEQIKSDPALMKMPVPALRGAPKIWGAAKAELTYLARLQDYCGIKTRPLG